MFFLFSEISAFDDGHILGEPERLGIADAKWAEFLYFPDSIECCELKGEISLHSDRFLGEFYIAVLLEKYTFYFFFEFFELIFFYSESCGLSVSAVSHEEVLACVEELDQIAPFGRPARCNEMSLSLDMLFLYFFFIFSLFHFCLTPIHMLDTQCYCRTIVGFCELAGNKSDEPMFQVFVYEEQNRVIWIRF